MSPHRYGIADAPRPDRPTAAGQPVERWLYVADGSGQDPARYWIGPVTMASQRDARQLAAALTASPPPPSPAPAPAGDSAAPGSAEEADPGCRCGFASFAAWTHAGPWHARWCARYRPMCVTMEEESDAARMERERSGVKGGGGIAS